MFRRGLVGIGLITLILCQQVVAHQAGGEERFRSLTQGREVGTIRTLSGSLRLTENLARLPVHEMQLAARMQAIVS